MSKGKPFQPGVRWDILIVPGGPDTVRCKIYIPCFFAKQDVLNTCLRHLLKLFVQSMDMLWNRSPDFAVVFTHQETYSWD